MEHEIQMIMLEQNKNEAADMAEYLKLLLDDDSRIDYEGLEDIKG